jgi:uncharacterized membrane protein YhaH (DUF805 family)
LHLPGKVQLLEGTTLAYGDTVGDNLYLLKRVVLGATDFTGRSRRTEVIYYWIAMVLIGVVVGFLRLSVAPHQSMVWFDVFMQALFVSPMFALFARRLHDQNRSAWWALLLPAALMLSIPGSANFDGIIPQKPTVFGIALEIVSIAVLILLLLPGTPGPNRFGPDPRSH